jgi:hypothetical protein
MVRLLGALGLIALGVLIGTLGAFVQAARWILEHSGSITVIPWGVAFVWMTLVLAVRAGTWLLGTRWGSWAVLLGWLGATIVFAAESPSGDLALSEGTRQMTYLVGGVILGSMASTFPLPVSYRRPARTPEASVGGTGDTRGSS